MEPIEFPDDFIEFLRLLNANEVEYLLVGAVGHVVDGSAVAVIGLEELKVNKRASGRSKELAELDNLP